MRPLSLSAVLAALMFLAALSTSACKSNGEPGPGEQPETPPEAGPGTQPTPVRVNLLANPGRKKLYEDLDGYTKRYMDARAQGTITAWESLHRTILTPMVRKNMDELVRTSASDAEPQFRILAVRGLGFAEDKARAGTALLDLLSESEPNLLSSALASLYILGASDTPLGPLVALLNHEDPDVRSNDALALFATLRARRQNGRVPSTSDVREASGRLVYLVTNVEEDEFVRGHAAAALGAIGDPAAADILTNLLEDPSSVVRTRAAEGLGQIGQEGAVIPLIDALHRARSPNEAVVIAAALEKIAQIRGHYCDAKVLGTDSKNWAAWYEEVRK